MLTTAINSASILSYQNYGKIHAADSAEKNSDAGRIAVSTGGRHKVGDDGFAAAVFQTLQGLGVDVQKSQSATANGNVDINNQGTASGDQKNLQQALHGFLHELHKALYQESSGVAAAGNALDAAQGTSKDSGRVSGLSVQNGYRDSSTNLSNLISSLNNGNGGNAALETDFSNLVQALGGVSKTSSSPTLESFLKTLQSNIGSNSHAISASSNLINEQA